MDPRTLVFGSAVFGAGIAGPFPWWKLHLFGVHFEDSLERRYCLIALVKANQRVSQADVCGTPELMYRLGQADSSLRPLQSLGIVGLKPGIANTKQAIMLGNAQGQGRVRGCVGLGFYGKLVKLDGFIAAFRCVRFFAGSQIVISPGSADEICGFLVLEYIMADSVSSAHCGRARLIRRQDLC